TGTTFNRGDNVSYITVDSGGTITPASSTFNLPLIVPYGDVASLGSGNNVSFDQVEINAGTLASGELDLNQIGTNPSSLVYIFSGAFTIASGAAVAVGPSVAVDIAGGPLTDNGTLSFGNADTVTLDYNDAVQLQLVVGGTMTSTGTTFN